MPETTAQKIRAEKDLVGPGGGFAAHYHPVDQLAWAQRGGMRVRVEDAHWRVTAGQLVWVPAFSDHEMWADGADSMLSLYVDPELRPRGERWQRPLVLPADGLLGEVVEHLCANECSPTRVQAGYALIRDILEHTSEASDALAFPEHPAAREVARAVIDDPAAAHTIEAWAGELEVSAKTLVRGFVSGTGLTFTQWRMRARMYRAARLLSEGWSVQDAAAEVGYATTTGFIKAYRGVYHATPAVHASRRRRV